MNWVYMARCGDGSLYTGWTTDVHKRMRAHNAGKGAKYTRGRGPVTLAYVQSVPSRGAALALEAKLKALSRGEKEAVVRGLRPTGAALAPLFMYM